MLHGATIIPSVLNEPLEMGAARSRLSYTTSARAATSSKDSEHSRSSTSLAPSLITRWVSTSPTSARARSMAMPSCTPVAPVMPTMIFRMRFSKLPKHRGPLVLVDLHELAADEALL